MHTFRLEPNRWVACWTLLCMASLPSCKAARMLPPYIVTPLPRCSIILERHTHKNGGTTMRSIIHQNDMRDGWAFWGYGLHQHQMITSRIVGAMLGHSNESCSFRRSGRPPLRLVAEHHYSRVQLMAMLGYFGPASPMQQVAAHCGCRVVLVTRLREPLSFYTSFYRWTVAWRQQRNGTEFGFTMLEWAPRNLQSSLLLTPLDATWVEFLGVRTADGRAKRQVYSQFDEPGSHLGSTGGTPPPGVGARNREELKRVLRSFDLVGLVERFDETLLMLADLTGLQRLLYTPSVPQSTNHHYKQPTVSQVCPRRKACAQRIREVAPMDHEIYTEMASAFDARVAALGAPFAERLRTFRMANAAYKKHVDAAVAADSFRAYDSIGHGGRVYARVRSAPTEMHVRVPMSKLSCPLGNNSVAIEACQRIFADTPFRFNWRHTRSACCQRIRYCLEFRLARRRPPNNCYKWLPYAADPYNQRGVRRGRAFEEMMVALNASMPSLCATECSAPPDIERRLMPFSYRVPTVVERASALEQARGPAKYLRPPPFESIGCNNTPSSMLIGALPWPDFQGCDVEGNTRENLRSTNGPCARDMWMRVNCKRTCGLCGLSLRQAIQLSPRVALRAARAAGKLRRVKFAF